jgi:cytochrome c-type biogenesis protein CcmH
VTAFWIIAAFFVVGALLFMLPPLLQRGGRKPKLVRKDITVSIYRDELAELDADFDNGIITRDQYEQSRQEFERRLLEDVAAEPAGEANLPATKGGRWAAAALGIAVPLLAVGLYFRLGNPQAITGQGQSSGAGAHQAGQMSPQQIQAMIAKLAARLAENPNDAEGWAMLARSYTVTGRFTEATRAYAKLNELVPNNPQVLADYADALAMAQGRRLAGEPVELINRALQADPAHPKSLALAGSAAYEARDYKQAAAYWERLLQVLPPDSESRESVAGAIAEAKALGAGASPAAAQAAAQSASKGAAPSTTDAAAAKVAGRVTLSAGLKDKVGPGDTLYIFARAPQGPKMPLAIVRLTAKELPSAFSLDDSTAMNPAMKLSNFPEVVVGARISKSGNATPQSGDLEGFSGPVKLGANGVQIVIDKVVP